MKEIFSVISHAVILINESDIICVFNDAAQQLFDLPSDARDLKISACTDNKKFIEVIASAKSNSEKGIVIKGQRYNCNIIIINNEKFKGKMVVFSEVTETDVIKQELLEVRALKEELKRSLRIPMTIYLSLMQREMWKKINDAYTRITGYKKEEIIASNIYDLVARGYFDRAATIDVIETRKTQTFTQTLKSGKTVLVTGNPIYSEKGEFIGVVTNGRDVTELNRLKQEVTQAKGLSQHYQKELMRIQLDSTGDYIVASQQMAEIEKT